MTSVSTSSAVRKVTTQSGDPAQNGLAMSCRRSVKQLSALASSTQMHSLMSRGFEIRHVARLTSGESRDQEKRATALHEVRWSARKEPSTIRSFNGRCA
jgi:hypothetical protein